MLKEQFCIESAYVLIGKESLLNDVMRPAQTSEISTILIRKYNKCTKLITLNTKMNKIGKI